MAEKAKTEIKPKKTYLTGLKRKIDLQKSCLKAISEDGKSISPDYLMQLYEMRSRQASLEFIDDLKGLCDGPMDESWLPVVMKVADRMVKTKPLFEVTHSKPRDKILSNREAASSGLEMMYLEQGENLEESKDFMQFIGKLFPALFKYWDSFNEISILND